MVSRVPASRNYMWPTYGGMMQIKVETRTVRAVACPDADGGDVQALGDVACYLVRDALTHHRHAPGLHTQCGVRDTRPIYLTPYTLYGAANQIKFTARERWHSHTTATCKHNVA